MNIIWSDDHNDTLPESAAKEGWWVFLPQYFILAALLLALASEVR